MHISTSPSSQSAIQHLTSSAVSYSIAKRKSQTASTEKTITACRNYPNGIHNTKQMIVIVVTAPSTKATPAPSVLCKATHALKRLKRSLPTSHTSSSPNRKSVSSASASAPASFPSSMVLKSVLLDDSDEDTAGTAPESDAGSLHGLVAPKLP